MPSRTPASRLASIHAIRARNRKFVWQYYSTHPCMECGEPDPLVLESHHCRGDKLLNVSQLAHNTRSLAVIQAELEKCDVLCSNCHKRHTAKSQGWYAEFV